MPVEPKRLPFIEQAPSERALEPGQPHQCGFSCFARIGRAKARPVPFDASYAIDDHFVVIAVRPTVEGERQALGSLLPRREKQPVATKIVKADPLGPKRLEQRGETCRAQQLTRKQMMLLQRRIMLRGSAAVDRTKRQVAATGEAMA